MWKSGDIILSPEICTYNQIVTCKGIPVMINFPIQMVDLQGQYLKIKPEVDAAIQEVIDSSAFIKGEQVKLFEQDLAQYLGIKHVIGCGNGTDALQIALMALGLKPGDEVITPNFTFIATVEVVSLLGLTPVLVDVDAGTFTMDIQSLKAAITPKTKAIIPVHLFGQCANMEQIAEIATKHNLFIIEDNAQALGADYTFSGGFKVKAGTIGNIATTSFFPSKNLGCFGDGGALMTNDDNLADIIRSIANHGMRIRYHHDRIGLNSRLDTLQAAILRVKLKYLDEYNTARIQAAKRYDKYFSSSSKVIIPIKASWSNHIYHQYTLRLIDGNRDELVEKLRDKRVPAMVYYPIPIDKQAAFEPYHKFAKIKLFPKTELLCKTVISLPMHTELTQEIQDYIAETIISLFD
jgi:dTDP-4-amino-4,6-dideoxygalactose transaminase